MADINLYGWREQEQERKNKTFVNTAVFCLLLGAALVWGQLYTTNLELNNQKGRVSFLEKEVKDFEASAALIQEIEVKKQEILGKIDIIQSLQKIRPVMVLSLDEIVSAIPKDVYLSKISRNNSQLSLVGYAINNDAVSRFIVNLGNTKTMENPKIKSVETHKQDGFEDSSKFEILVSLTEDTGDFLEQEKEVIK